MNLNNKIVLENADADIYISDLRKQVYITLSGNFNYYALQDFLRKYTDHTLSLNKKEYNLIFDCYLLGLIQQDLLEGFEDTFKMFTDFKSIIIINPFKQFAKMQLIRIAKKNNYLNFFKFVNMNNIEYYLTGEVYERKPGNGKYKLLCK